MAAGTNERLQSSCENGTKNTVAMSAGLSDSVSLRVEQWPGEYAFDNVSDTSDALEMLFQRLHENEGVVRDLGGLGWCAYVVELQCWESHDYGPGL